MTTPSKTWAHPWRRWRPSHCWTSATTGWQRWACTCVQKSHQTHVKSPSTSFSRLLPGPGGSPWTSAPALHGVQRHWLAARELPERPHSAAVCEDGPQPADRQGHPSPHLQRDGAGGAGPELQQAGEDPPGEQHAAAPLPAGQPDQRYRLLLKPPSTISVSAHESACTFTSCSVYCMQWINGSKNWLESHSLLSLCRCLASKIEPHLLSCCYVSYFENLFWIFFRANFQVVAKSLQQQFRFNLTEYL